MFERFILLKNFITRSINKKIVRKRHLKVRPRGTVLVVSFSYKNEVLTPPPSTAFYNRTTTCIGTECFCYELSSFRVSV